MEPHQAKASGQPGDGPVPGAGFEASVGAAMLASSLDCVKVIGLDGSLTFLSDFGRRLLELDPDAVPLGMPWADTWPKESRAKVLDALSEAAAGRVARFTAFSPTVRGTAKWWDVVVRPMRDDEGTVIAILAVARDITQQKSVESALAASEQRFRALADNMAQLAWMADSNGDVFWYSRRWLDYCGVTLEEMRGAGWRKVHHPDYVARVEARFASAFRRREVWEDVLPLRGADGSYRWFLARAVPVMDPAGRVTLWCATHTDITDQRRLSQRLRQLARVIEMSHEAILVWDFERGIILWNKGCEELYQFRRSEALGARVNNLLATRHEAGIELVERLLLRDGEWSGELLRRAKDGSEVWVDCSLELIRSDNRNLVLETDRDITDRRRADEIRELLVAELDHRVNNTLAVVQSIAAQTARTRPDASSFLASFTGRLQALASAQRILSNAHWSSADLRQLIRSQVTLIAGDATNVSIDGADVLLPPETALQLTLILHELATNALRHGALSHPAGCVAIEWERDPKSPLSVVIEWRETGGPPVGRVSSRGFGRSLIERAGQLPNLRTALELLPQGARCLIWLELPERGASRVYLNARRRISDPRGERMPRRSLRRAGRRVLLVGDDPLELQRAEEILAEAGYLVVGPAHTTEAVERYLQEPAFDLAILDTEAATLDVHRLKTLLESRSKPTVALVSRSVTSSGQQGALEKPVSADRLLEAVAKVSSIPT